MKCGNAEWDYAVCCREDSVKRVYRLRVCVKRIYRQWIHAKGTYTRRDSCKEHLPTKDSCKSIYAKRRFIKIEDAENTMKTTN